MRKILLFLILLFLSFSPAQAANNKVGIVLVAEQTTIVPGQAFWVGIKQDIPPHWHTYWRNPGDSGLATTVEWTLPAGFTADDISWPTPQRLNYEKAVNFGYENQVILPVKITPPADIKTGENINLTADINWLVCADVCIPEQATVSLKLPVAATASVNNAALQKTMAALPAKFDGVITAQVSNKNLVLQVTNSADNKISAAAFFPDEPLIIQNAARQVLTQNGRALTLTIPLDVTTVDLPNTIAGTLSLTTPAGATAYVIDSSVETSAPAAAIRSLWLAVALAFCGGLILNLMPCVFPVLSIKALSLVRDAHHDNRRHIVTGGLVYTAGVVLSFLVLAAILLSLKTAGHEIGWGIQLQSPLAVAVLALVLFIIGLLLAGIATVGGSFVNAGSRLAAQTGHSGTFFTGVLAVLVATPCTAPFMGGAIFYALTQPWYISFMVFTALGLGLAAPYLLLTLYPPVLKFLPKPGPWMESFKQFLAFPMFAAAMWLVWVLSQQIGPSGVLLILSSMLLAAFGLWLWQNTAADIKRGTWFIIKRVIAIAAFILALDAVVQMSKAPMVMPTGQSTKVSGAEPYSAARLAELRAEHQPVFIDMGAAWCLTCLVNENGALASANVTAQFAKQNITLLKGDWTNHDAAITDFLSQFNRNGVPLYVYYPVSGAPVVLPQILTPDIIINTLTGARP